jgi:hypothetical protein
MSPNLLEQAAKADRSTTHSSTRLNRLHPRLLEPYPPNLCRLVVQFDMITPAWRRYTEDALQPFVAVDPSRWPDMERQCRIAEINSAQAAEWHGYDAVRCIEAVIPLTKFVLTGPDCGGGDVQTAADVRLPMTIRDATFR